MPSRSAIVVIGTGPWAGAYLLRIEVSAALCVRFGRFANQEALTLLPGAYLYVGSAQGSRGAPLLNRVARHLRRTPSRPPQFCWEDWIAFLAGQNVSLQPPSPKHLHWHIDFLLDEPAAQVKQVILIPSPRAIEQPLAQYIEGLTCTAPPAVGLGASDHPGHTHLLRWQGTQTEWVSLLDDLPARVPAWQQLA